MHNGTISSAVAELGRQLLPDRVLPDASVDYRKNLAQALFYKFVLGLDPSKVRFLLHTFYLVLKINNYNCVSLLA